MLGGGEAGKVDAKIQRMKQCASWHWPGHDETEAAAINYIANCSLHLHRALGLLTRRPLEVSESPEVNRRCCKSKASNSAVRNRSRIVYHVSGW